jgi:hypothetical protein
MMLHNSGTLDYEAEFTEQSFRGSDILLRGADRGGGVDECLVGPRPDIRLGDDLLIVFTSEPSLAAVGHASFPVGDAVGLAARPGDRLHVCRAGTGDIGLSLLRGRKLVLAVGAITAVPLGESVRAANSPECDWRKPPADTWLEFSAGAVRVALRGREFSQAGDYHVYVERSWSCGIPGKRECAAAWAGDDPAMRVAALRSAVLLGHGALKLVGWENTEQFIELK